MRACRLLVAATTADTIKYRFVFYITQAKRIKGYITIQKAAKDNHGPISVSHHVPWLAKPNFTVHKTIIIQHSEMSVLCSTVRVSVHNKHKFRLKSDTSIRKANQLSFQTNQPQSVIAAMEVYSSVSEMGCSLQGLILPHYRISRGQCLPPWTAAHSPIRMMEVIMAVKNSLQTGKSIQNSIAERDEGTLACMNISRLLVSQRSNRRTPPFIQTENEPLVTHCRFQN
jgi:hypothetical protein